MTKYTTESSRSSKLRASYANGGSVTPQPAVRPLPLVGKNARAMEEWGERGDRLLGFPTTNKGPSMRGRLQGDRKTGGRV